MHYIEYQNISAILRSDYLFSFILKEQGLIQTENHQFIYVLLLMIKEQNLASKDLSSQRNGVPFKTK